jgi:hypothetical protein
LGTASALIVSGAILPGVRLTLGGLAIATVVIALPEELIGYGAHRAAARGLRHRDRAVAGSDLAIFAVFSLVELAYMVCAVAVADLVSSGFDVDGVFAYVITTALVFVGTFVFWWMSPWYKWSREGHG